MSALRSLKARMPAANAGVAQQVDASNLLRAQQVAGAAPAGADSGQLRTAGAGMAASAGQTQVERTAAAAQTQLAGAQNVVATRRLEAQSAAAGRELHVAANRRANELRLAQLDSETKRELIDARAKFATDEAGRLILNQKQLADLALVKAKSREELANRMQYMEQASKKRLLATDLMYKRATQEIEARTARAIQEGRQDVAQQLAEYKRQIQEAYMAEVAEAQNRAMIIQGVLGIGGAVAGGIFGGPMGAAAGYSAGSGVGAMAANNEYFGKVTGI